MASTGTEIKITPQIAAEHGLTADEFARIQKILGRDPNFTELGIFSVMWSEHCSYKSSRVHLKRLPTRGAHVVQGPGENAGVVDIGDGLVAVFKIESHNHPSFVEPFQGAATGVGGILRDIFTMGARPIAVLDSLRFGPITPGPAAGKATPEEIARNRRIADGVVRGISFYGNCFGVPTVGGEVVFEPCYSNNPLVNALALGIAHKDDLFFASARGEGNPVIYVGAKTGRDGIHGASLLASAEFSEESQQKRPNVQVGDPFMEKLLLEACLEAMRTGAIVAIQDMGAAGLASSSSEMASRGGLGIEMDLDRVPQRETNMTPYEMMLSESQERMLLVADRGRERQVFDVFHKWGLDAVEIGRVTTDGKLRLLHHRKVVAEIPAHALAEEGPRYERPIAQPSPSDLSRGAASRAKLIEFAPAGTDLTENFRKLLASPTIASKNWITEQYDSMVRTNTRVGPGSGDAAVLRLKESKRALAIKTDGNGRWSFLSPRIGAMHSVAEAARNVACTGARPIAATNCLNFGNPEKPEVMWQFTQAIDGISEACRVLETPITGGNVSFYNETLGNPIYPTPILGVLGLIEDADWALSSGFRNEGDLILLLDANPSAVSADQQRAEFSSSEYANTIHGIVAGAPPAIDLDAEKNLINCLVVLAAEKAAASAHDLSDGGLAVALAESCFASADDSGACLSADVSFGGRSVPALSNSEGQPAEHGLSTEGSFGGRSFPALSASEGSSDIEAPTNSGASAPEEDPAEVNAMRGSFGLFTLSRVEGHSPEQDASAEVDTKGGSPGLFTPGRVEGHSREQDASAEVDTKDGSAGIVGSPGLQSGEHGPSGRAAIATAPTGALAPENTPTEFALFAERGARAIVSLPPASLARAASIAAKYSCNVQRIGTVIRGAFRIQYNGTTAIAGDVSSLREIWSETLAKALESA